MIKKILFLICLLILLIRYETTGSNLSPKQAEPVVPPEAFYVAAVVQDGKATKFFTLEKTFCPTETPQCDNTVLGGWTKNGTHVNYGIGPAPTKENFLSALEGKL